jgi:hypothetical protein
VDGGVRGAWRRAALAALPVLFASQGCYSYHVTQLPALTPGEQVRLELGNQGQGTLPENLGRRRFEGRLARLTQDSVIVSIWIGEAYAGTPFESTYQDLVLPRVAVARVENRQIDKVRTALLGVGTVAVIAYLIRSVGAFDIFAGRGSEDPPTPPDGLLRRDPWPAAGTRPPRW